MTQQWKPISNAPKDGTEIILTNGVNVSSGNWHHDEGGTTEYRDLDGRYMGQDDRDGFEGWIDWMGGMNPEPTHWMPLPAAPCLTCNGHGMVGGLTPHSGYDAEPCPDCTPPASAQDDAKDERQAFEAWHKREFGDFMADAANHYNRWLGWQGHASIAAPAAGDALGAVTLVTRQGRGQELFTYTSQPCDNVIAWRIGEACSKASVTSAGDYIDRGLSLLKELQRKGYGIADISAAQRKGDA